MFYVIIGLSTVCKGDRLTYFHVLLCKVLEHQISWVKSCYLARHDLQIKCFSMRYVHSYLYQFSRLEQTFYWQLLLYLHLRKQVLYQSCTYFFRSAHNSHLFLDFDQRERSVLDADLGPFAPQSHTLMTVPLPFENEYHFSNINSEI